MANSNFLIFQLFIKQLCTQHKDLMHDDQANVVFVALHSHDDLNQVQNHGAASIVVMARYYGRPFGGNPDELQIKNFVQIRFACYAQPDPGQNFSDTITGALDKSFSIMMDFIARMSKEMHDDDCGPLRGLELENANWAEIPEQPYLLGHFGWDLTVPFNNDFPGYDASKWM